MLQFARRWTGNLGKLAGFHTTPASALQFSNLIRYHGGMSTVSAYDNFRINLKSVMADEGVTLRAMGELCETSFPYIHKVLRGEICPSIQNCERMAGAVGYSLAELLVPPLKFSPRTPIDIS